MPKPVKGVNYMATESFRTPAIKGHVRGVLVVRGETILPGSDVLVKKYPQFFEPVDDVVERATAGPGEKRAVSIPDDDG